MAVNKLKRVAYYATGVVGLRSDDVLLSSFPRSGNTWVRFLLCNLISLNELDGETVDFTLLNRTMPELGVNNLLQPWKWKTIPRIVKTHKNYLPIFSKCRSIGIVRDPRDVMVSYFHFMSHRKQLFSGSFSEFIRTQRWGLPAWFNHYASWSKYWTLLIHYEGLKKDTFGELKRLISFLNVTLPDDCLEQAVERASAGKVEPRDTTTSGVPDHARFVRSTGVNQWQDYFEQEDLSYYNSLASSYSFQSPVEVV